MAEIKMSGDTIYVKVEGLDKTRGEPGKPDADSKDKEDSDNADARAIMGLGKQALGYIPGADDVLGAVGSATNTVSTLSDGIGKGGVVGYAAIAALALKLGKQAIEMIISLEKDKRQSEELQRRSGNRRTDK